MFVERLFYNPVLAHGIINARHIPESDAISINSGFISWKFKETASYSRYKANDKE